VVGGSDNPDAISSRVSQSRAKAEETTSNFDKEKLQERLAKLSSGVAVIKHAAATATVSKERKLSIEDALKSTRTVVEEGIVSGGRTALINVYNKVGDLSLQGDEATGASIVLRALEEPVRQIAHNAGLEGSIVVERLKREEVGTGFDAANGDWVNMVD